MSEKTLKERLNNIRDLTTSKGGCSTLKETRPPSSQETKGKKTIKINLSETLINKLDLLRLTDEYRFRNRRDLILALLEEKLKEGAVEEAILKLTKSVK